MRRFARSSALGLVLAASTLVACVKVPITGRRQANLIPDTLMRQIGASTYQSTLAEEKVAKGTENAKVINSVGKKIAKSADQPKFDWQFKLLQNSESINAWCLPGGKIAVYTGLLPVVESEAGLAFVMGHEVGHATAHHGAERLSQQLAVLGGMGALYLYLDNKTEMTPQQMAVISAAAGAGAQVGYVLPFSRLHEKEADVIGMMYMAKSGYPPQEAPLVWDRMEAATGGGQLSILSTHPTNKDRKKNLNEWMPNAKKRYKRNKGKVKGDSTAQLWSASQF
ncbi:MAG: putative Zn-dependent protease [Cognaticolwellia sp.]|jgi:predicted Zn-dependent protease